MKVADFDENGNLFSFDDGKIPFQDFFDKEHKDELIDIFIEVSYTFGD